VIYFDGRGLLDGLEDYKSGVRKAQQRNRRSSTNVARPIHKKPYHIVARWRTFVYVIPRHLSNLRSFLTRPAVWRCSRCLATRLLRIHQNSGSDVAGDTRHRTVQLIKHVSSTAVSRRRWSAVGRGARTDNAHDAVPSNTRYTIHTY